MNRPGVGTGLGSALAAEHREHATRDGEAAEHVDGSERERRDGQAQYQFIGSVATGIAMISGDAVKRDRAKEWQVYCYFHSRLQSDEIMQ